jgi:alpha-1,3-glucan synthase
MKPYEFKAYVPKNVFVSPPPMITKFLPGHDTGVQSQVPAGSQETLDVEIHFSAEMDCDSVTPSIQLNSTTEELRIAEVQPDSVVCGVSTTPEQPTFIAGLPTAWTWKAKLWTGRCSNILIVTQNQFVKKVHM